MKWLIVLLFIPLINNAQIIPDNSDYNQNIIWESVFTEGNPGKVNRGLVDSDGNLAVIFMPDNQSRIHKINGQNGELIWSVTINNTVGFGITEINDNNRVDYIVSGGSGNTQERWLARLNGDNGSIIWSQDYNSSGNSSMYDGIRSTIIGNDGYIYGAGFIGGDESDTIFIVYGGNAMSIKVNPSNGQEIWTAINNQTEYAVSIVESSDGNLYYGSTNYEGDLTLTKLNNNGSELWTRNLSGTEAIIPADLDIHNDVIYYGGHREREGNGEPFDYSSIKIDLEANILWEKHYANPRGYDLEYIRNELYGIKVSDEGIYLFGGTGDENESYSAVNPPFEASDIWNGWVLFTDYDGNVIRSDVFCHEEVNTATEYGDLTENGYVIFNDTDAFGDTEVGVMKIVNPSLTNDSYGVLNSLEFFPNPFPDYINVNSDKELKAVIFDMIGNELFRNNINDRLDLRFLERGTYILNLSDGKNISSHKIIKN